MAKSLRDIYPEDQLEHQTKRWNNLIGQFEKDFGKLPDFVSRSPGRVNIIGEVCGIGSIPRIADMKLTI